VLVVNCSGTKIIKYSPEKIGALDNCHTSRSSFRYDSLITPPAAQQIPANAFAEKRFSRRVIRIAASLGITNLLNEFAQLESETKTDQSKQLKLDETRQKAYGQINLATIEISSVLAELECEANRASALKTYIEAQINERINRLNILSITVGAISGMIVGMLNIKNTNNQISVPLIEGIGVVGAAAGGYWALRQLAISRKAEFKHTRNHLQDIKENPQTSYIFPPAIWHFLITPFKIRDSTTTGRDILLRTFQNAGAMEDAKITAILFGKGGLYSVEMLGMRMNMLQLLITEINLMKYELKRLYQELLLDAANE
jgi:hypothetical protein